jgi:hypothetical protein
MIATLDEYPLDCYYYHYVVLSLCGIHRFTGVYPAAQRVGKGTMARCAQRDSIGLAQQP